MNMYIFFCIRRLAFPTPAFQNSLITICRRIPPVTAIAWLPAQSL